MGGNALKNVETRRYERDEYFRLAGQTTQRLIDSGFVTHATTIKSYRNKPSFGDQDILYTTYNDKPLDADAIRIAFAPDEIVRNGDVISFNVEQLQVDVIHTPIEKFEYAENYFAWNDQGNLVGRIAKKFGLKHGHDGLFLPVRDGDQVFAEILLTNDYEEALAWLGFRVDRYQQGFDELEDIFDWVSENPFYNPDFYKLENLNHVAKIRDRKRSTYNAFLKYGEDLEKEGKQFWLPVAERSFYMKEIFESFPEALPQYDAKMRELAVIRYVRTKFNGNIVAEVTGLEGKELGMFMRELKNDFWFSYASIIYQSDEQIRMKIEYYFDTFKRNLNE